MIVDTVPGKWSEDCGGSARSMQEWQQSLDFLWIYCWPAVWLSSPNLSQQLDGKNIRDLQCTCVVDVDLPQRPLPQKLFSADNRFCSSSKSFDSFSSSFEDLCRRSAIRSACTSRYLFSSSAIPCKTFFSSAGAFATKRGRCRTNQFEIRFIKFNRSVNRQIIENLYF